MPRLLPVAVNFRPLQDNGGMTILLLVVALLLGEQTAAAKPDGSLRVATFNIRYGTANDGDNRWELRRELAFRTIAEMDPDVAASLEAARLPKRARRPHNARASPARRGRT